MSAPNQGSDQPPKTEAEYVRGVRESTLPFDPELESLVAFINLADSTEVGLTLHVNGTVVSGMLISAAQFYRLLIADITNPDRLGEHSDPEDASGFAEFFHPTLASYEKSLEEYRTKTKLPPRPRHIHLRYAQTLVSTEQTLPPTLWRGRLTEIDGWAIGNFGFIPPLDNTES